MRLLRMRDKMYSCWRVSIVLQERDEAGKISH